MRIRSALTVPLLVAVGVAIAAGAGSGPSPHRLTGAGRQDCLLCHLTIPAYRGAGAAAEVKSDIDRVCSSCHNDIRKLITHKVGTKPLIPIPADFPLDSKGQMSCVTCHVVHGSYDRRPFLLRKGVTGKAFCQLCHTEEIFWKDVAPAFTAKGIGGSPIDLSRHLKRRTIVLAFFSYTSIPSIRQLEAVEEAAKRYGGEKLFPLGISTDYLVPQETVRNYLASLNPFPTYGVVIDSTASLVELYSIKAVPTVVVIDTYGKIRLKLSGWTTEDREKLFTMLDKLTK
jgi:predicted CXXCH cytochrome family protein